MIVLCRFAVETVRSWGRIFPRFGPHLGQLIMLEHWCKSDGFVKCFFGLYCRVFICIMPMIYLAVAWYFTIPLVIDKELGFWEGDGDRAARWSISIGFSSLPSCWF